MYMPKLSPVPLNCESNSRLKQLWFWIKSVRKWMITEDYVIYYNERDKYIYIPKDFIIDGASIPKIFYNIFNPVGILLLGAIPHDVGYKYNGLMLLNIDTGQLYFEHYSKEELDIIFSNINIHFNNLPHITRYAYLALKYFGFFAWNNHRKHNNKFSDDFSEYLDNYQIPESIKLKFCKMFYD